MMYITLRAAVLAHTFALLARYLPLLYAFGWQVACDEIGLSKLLAEHIDNFRYKSKGPFTHLALQCVDVRQVG